MEVKVSFAYHIPLTGSPYSVPCLLKSPPCVEVYDAVQLFLQRRRSFPRSVPWSNNVVRCK